MKTIAIISKNPEIKAWSENHDVVSDQEEASRKARWHDLFDILKSQDLIAKDANVEKLQVMLSHETDAVMAVEENEDCCDVHKGLDSGAFPMTAGLLDLLKKMNDEGKLKAKVLSAKD